MNARPDLPVLEPERVARMRSNVMERIDTDEQRATTARGRRRRRIIVGVAAAASAAVVGGLGVGALTELSGQQSTMSADIESDSSAGAESLAGKETPDQPPGTPLASTVIVSGSMSVTVTDAETALDDLEAFARERGGRIDDERLDTTTTRMNATATVRLPASQVPELRRELDRLGTLGSVELSREDVATQVADVDARIESLRTSIGRLRDIVAQSTDTKALLDAEARLTERQGELESLQAQRRVLQDRTSLATVSVDITEREAAAAVEPSGFLGGLTRGWNALAATTNAVVTTAGILTPWFLPAGLLVALALAVRRGASRGR